MEHQESIQLCCIHALAKYYPGNDFWVTSQEIGRSPGFELQLACKGDSLEFWMVIANPGSTADTGRIWRRLLDSEGRVPRIEGERCSVVHRLVKAVRL